MELKEETRFEIIELDTILSNSTDISKNLVFRYKNLYANFKEYLKFGCYPFFLESKESYFEKLNNSLEKIINEDIPSINKIEFSHLSILEKIIYFVTVANEPFLVNIASLSRELTVSEPTIYTYINILSKSRILMSIRKSFQRELQKAN